MSGVASVGNCISDSGADKLVLMFSPDRAASLALSAALRREDRQSWGVQEILMKILLFRQTGCNVFPGYKWHKPKR